MPQAPQRRTRTRKSLAAFEGPLTGLATRPLGSLDASALGERSRLPLAAPGQLLDLCAQRVDDGGLLENQGHQRIAIKLGKVDVTHGG